VLHDLQCALAADRAAQAIAGVGEAIFMEGAGEPHCRAEREPCRDAGRKQLPAAPPREGRHTTDKQTDRRKMARAGVQPLRLVAHPARYRNPGEELQRDEEEAQFVAHQASRFETPADSKLAISRSTRTALASSGHASAAPEPSPRRKPRSSKGFAFRCFSSSAWPASPERCANTQ